jgi:hypothetical protein
MNCAKFSFLALSVLQIKKLLLGKSVFQSLSINRFVLCILVSLSFTDIHLSVKFHQLEEERRMKEVAIVTRQEMADNLVPHHVRDNCAAILIPLNK